MRIRGAARGVRTAAAARRWILAGLVLVAAGPSCESDAEGNVQSYTDTAGRSCTVDLSDISRTATCDVDPTTLVTCEPTREPAVVLSDDYDRDSGVFTLESCGACIDREERMTYIGSASCANVECEMDIDCLFDIYMCQGGTCRHM